MPRWVRVAGVDDVADGEGIAVDAGGLTVGLFRCGDEWFAVDDVCTHAFAYLHEGSVDRVRCTVECPLHASEFDLRTGEVLTPPATEPAPAFPVRVEGPDVLVELPDS
jgi:nitrite reductase/ring-hydroxylating ferredoxin subunit